MEAKMCKGLKTVDIKGKPYVEVNERIKYFRENYKDYSLESDIISNDNGVVVIKATIKDPDGVIKATGYAYEKEGSSFINKTSYIENCETSAWGRALGNFGIGIDTSIASADEVLNAVKQQAETDKLNNDIDLIEGLKACSDLTNLKKYYQTYYNKVINKKAFEAEKDKIKKFLTEMEAKQ